ncbi:MAG: NRDE family protein [Gammaproteobacteria bacterium]|nr:NRDE family protein [Gammaproteobacteria bacterium]
MCLVAIAWRAHPDYPLVIAGNRDEFHVRPSAAAAWWDEAADVLGGRDLVAGGSWLAIGRNGRFAVVVNDPRRPPGPTRTASRGQLVRDFVTGNRPGGRYLDAVSVAAERYAGFCLVLGTPVQVRALRSPNGNHRARWTLPPGITVIGNSPPEDPAPKVAYLRDAASAVLAGTHPDPAAWLDALVRRGPVGLSPGGTPGTAHAPFIVGTDYGTRASTVVLVDAGGGCEFVERRYDADGAPAGTVHERFRIG